MGGRTITEVLFSIFDILECVCVSVSIMYQFSFSNREKWNVANCFVLDEIINNKTFDD